MNGPNIRRRFKGSRSRRINSSKKYDAGSKLNELFEQDCDYLRRQLEDPLLENDSTVTDGIPELQAMREQMATMLKRMSEVSERLAGAQKEAA